MDIGVETRIYLKAEEQDTFSGKDKARCPHLRRHIAMLSITQT